MNKEVGAPLIGDKVASQEVDNVVFAVKSGETNDYDEKIVEILKTASIGRRELNDTEKKEINSIKQARTDKFFK